MISKSTKCLKWLPGVAILFLLSLTATSLAQNKVSFTITSDGTPVKGISLGVEGIVLKTNSLGVATIFLPDGDYSYMVYTAGAEESIVVGSSTFNYFDDGGSDREDRYNNIFKSPTSFSVSGETSIDATITSTTFNTTIGGSAASGVFNILAEYFNKNGYLKTKTITMVASDESGTVTIPLPTHRDDRQENILSFNTYFTSDLYEQNITAFDPMLVPVNVVIPTEATLDFTITAGSTAVEGIYVTVAGKTLKTDDQGQVSVDLPDGTYYYSVFSGGYPESFMIEGDTYIYGDDGGREGEEDSYDNIFVANAAVTVSGASTANVDLLVIPFQTKDQGVDASLSFELTADYSGSKTKTLAKLTSSASGDIALPLPTHRNTRNDDTLAFSNFQYTALSGIYTNTFTPDGSLVTVDLPATHELTFNVQSSGMGVGGITIRIDEVTKKTDVDGQASFILPAGDYSYMLYTAESPEILTIGTNSFTYNDDGERGSSDRYDNVFVNTSPISVTATATQNISLPATTFNTTVEGSVASVDFDIIAEYMNQRGSLQNKTITTLSSDESGTIAAPLPTHRDDRQGNILSFDTFYTSDSYGNNTTAFDPLVSPVSVAVPAVGTVDFAISAGDAAVHGIYVRIGEQILQTDTQGELSFELPDGTYYYTVFSGGYPESFKIGADTYVYEDMGGREDREDSYDNIFVANAALIVSGSGTESVDLPLTPFKTKVEGVDASASFDVIAEYSGSKIKTIAELTSNASGDIALPLPTHRNTRNDDTLAFSYYQYWALNGMVNDTFEVDDNPVIIDFPTLYETTFTVETGGIAVEGISLGVNGEAYLTNATGQMIISLPAGDYNYSVYTGGSPETITVGANTVTFLDEGGSGDQDAFDNIFIENTPFTVSGAATVNIALASTTFQTTIGGTAASLKFTISAGYINDSDEAKRKTLTTLSSNASGIISVPLPISRDNRYGDTLEYYNYFYADLALSTQGLFDPSISPVEINIPAEHNITFIVLAGSNPVQGMIIGVNQIEATTDASGHAVLKLPLGEYDYFAMTMGHDETLTVNGESFNYLDIGGSNYDDRYDNIFNRGSVIVSGEGTMNISLLTPAFMTTVGGVAASADFAIKADYMNSSGDRQVKTIVQVASNVSGDISIPLPTHRTSRQGPIIDFENYFYEDLLGIVAGEFDPDNSPILIALPSSNDVEFVVTSGGKAVKGISIRIVDLTDVSNASGEITLSLPDGSYDFMLYTAGKTETISIDGTSFTYKNEAGNEAEWLAELGYVPDAYNNVFHMAGLEVSGASTENIEIGSTTFETTVNGSSAPVSLLISGDYVNDSDDLKTKKISTFSTGTGGTISLPIPQYRDDREGNILEFITFHYADISNTASGIFDPTDSPVQIAFGNMNEVTFNITNSLTSNPVQNAVVIINGAALMATDENGETSTGLAAGTYHYTVTRPGYLDIESTTFETTEATMTIEIAMEATVGVQKEVMNSFTFFPNPASEVVRLRFAEPFTGTIQLYSIMGSLVKQFQFENELSGTIQISGLHDGMYIIRAGAISKRLLIK